MSKRVQNLAIIAGIDEAGRGALAGPVAAGACILPIETSCHGVSALPRFIRDSKELTPELREEAFAWIAAHCMYGFGMAEAAFVDSHGILAATERAMQEAVRALAEQCRPTYLLVDGRDKFWFDYPHSAMIDGDRLEPCISAASIVAKVTRDRMMTEFDKTFPGYGFAVHKGYGTPEHFAAIGKKGPCAIHRQTFLRKMRMAAASSSASYTTTGNH